MQLKDLRNSMCVCSIDIIVWRVPGKEIDGLWCILMCTAKSFQNQRNLHLKSLFKADRPVPVVKVLITFFL